MTKRSTRTGVRASAAPAGRPDVLRKVQPGQVRAGAEGPLHVAPALPSPSRASRPLQSPTPHPHLRLGEGPSSGGLPRPGAGTHRPLVVGKRSGGPAHTTVGTVRVRREAVVVAGPGRGITCEGWGTTRTGRVRVAARLAPASALAASVKVGPIETSARATREVQRESAEAWRGLEPAWRREPSAGGPFG